jgi:hypothetical protein
MTECWMTLESRVKTPFGRLASPSGDPKFAWLNDGLPEAKRGHLSCLGDHENF